MKKVTGIKELFTIGCLSLAMKLMQMSKIRQIEM